MVVMGIATLWMVVFIYTRGSQLVLAKGLRFLKSR